MRRNAGKRADGKGRPGKLTRSVSVRLICSHYHKRDERVVRAKICQISKTTHRPYDSRLKSNVASRIAKETPDKFSKHSEKLHRFQELLLDKLQQKCPLQPLAIRFAYDASNYRTEGIRDCDGLHLKASAYWCYNQLRRKPMQLEYQL